MKSVLTKKTYNLITNPDLPGYSVENFGDRKFILRGNYSRAWTESDGFRIGGDRHWEINDTNILMCANSLLEKKVEEIEEEKNRTIERANKNDKEIENGKNNEKAMWYHFDEAFANMDKFMKRVFGGKR